MTSPERAQAPRRIANADSVHGRTWGKQGQTPVVERPGQRQSISAASAANARGGSGTALYKSALELSDSVRCNGRQSAIMMVRRRTADLKPGVFDARLRGCGLPTNSQEEKLAGP
jgi:hypothetical protein